MSQEINNFNVDILEKGIDWNTAGVSQGEDVPELIVNGTSFALSSVEEDPEGSGAYIGYSGSAQVGGKSRMLEVWLRVENLAASSDPTINWVEDVTDNHYAIEFDPDQDPVYVGPGESTTVLATGTKEGESYDAGTFNWQSDDTSIATVDQNGTITGVTAGSTQVVASWEVDGIYVSRSLNVDVNNPM